MSKLHCNVIRDLLPSYADEICSKESRELIDEHLSECADCKDYLKRMSMKNDSMQWKEEKEVDCMKKVRQIIDVKSLIFMVIIAVTSAVFSAYSITYGDNPMIFFTLLPLVLICNYFMFFQTRDAISLPAGKSAGVLGVLEVFSLIYSFILMRVTVPHWIDIISHNGKLPFGLQITNIGPFVNLQLVLIMLIQVVIWGVTIFLHMNEKKFYITISGSSLILLYCNIYYRFILRTLDNVNDFTHLCNNIIWLFLEGIAILSLLGFLNLWKQKQLMK